MDSFKEKINNDCKTEEGERRDYSAAADIFLTNHGFVKVENADDESQLGGVSYRNYKFKQNVQQSSEKGHGENKPALELLETPEFLRDFFEKRGFRNVLPKSIINEKGGSTLFISAGVQILDPVIHNEQEIPAEKFYVAQPVFRTQFIPKIDEGVSSSFINISTEMINRSPEEHFSALNQWFELLKMLGLDRENLTLKTVKQSDKWGKHSFSVEKIKIHYGNISLGDAEYIDMSQDSRDNILISDIGFGLERIKWLLSGRPYLESIAPAGEMLFELDQKAIDYARTMTLLSASGVKPSNREQGYRFRQLSKLFTKINFGKKADLNSLINYFYNYWKAWTDPPIIKAEALKIINTENERNFNRELLDILKERYSDVDIDINQPTNNVIKLLNGTSVDKKYLREILDKIL